MKELRVIAVQLLCATITEPIDLKFSNNVGIVIIAENRQMSELWLIVTGQYPNILAICILTNLLGRSKVV